MSSYLTNRNQPSHVLDYAKSTECVLFFDELDMIAKRRDDQGNRRTQATRYCPYSTSR